MRKYDVAVIGGGPAGMQAAIAAVKNGAEKVVILERDRELGGILNQCIHVGFGLSWFKEELTGTQYAARFVRLVDSYLAAKKIDVLLHTMVLSVSPDLVVRFISKQNGIGFIQAGAVVMATGCRERTRGAIQIPGARPAGIYTAGTVQRLVNMEGYLPGRRVLIVGSGDVGLIMARRLRLEGLEVAGAVEIYPYPGGLMRNVVQCLHDYDIPLWLSTTVTDIHGQERVTGVTLSRVDRNLQIIPGTEKDIFCDTLLLSVGLIPENELLRTPELNIEFSPATGGPLVNECLMTSRPGIFACGNNLHVHDLVDNVSAEADTAGKSAALFAGGNRLSAVRRKVIAGPGVRYVTPSSLPAAQKDFLAREDIPFYFRIHQPYTKADLLVTTESETVLQRKLLWPRPGEMLSFRLNPEKITSPGDITVYVRGGDTN